MMLVRETDPEAYQEMQEKLQAFKENLEKLAGEKGIIERKGGKRYGYWEICE